LLAHVVEAERIKNLKEEVKENEVPNVFGNK